MRENNFLKIIVLGTFLIIIPSLFFAQRISERGTLMNQVGQCNSVDSVLRFSCYRSILEKYYGGDIEKAFAMNHEKFVFSSNNNKSYAIFGTSCHTFYHAWGDFIATHKNVAADVRGALELCPIECTSGCMMGLYKRTALKEKFSTELLKEFYTFCKTEERNSCSHEIGHLLHDKYTLSILEVLDGISRSEYELTYDTDYPYRTFEKSDLNAPFEECRYIVPEEKWEYCFTGVGHNLFLFSEFSPEGYKTQLAECAVGTREEERENCFAFLVYRIGINAAAPKFLLSQFEEGRSICDETVVSSGIPQLKEDCYVGIGGGIGLFVDSEYHSYSLTNENYPYMQKEISKYMHLCEESEIGFREACFRGLLGTRFKALYLWLELHSEDIEKLLPDINDKQVVG